MISAKLDLPVAGHSSQYSAVKSFGCTDYLVQYILWNKRLVNLQVFIHMAHIVTGRTCNSTKAPKLH